MGSKKNIYGDVGRYERDISILRNYNGVCSKIVLCKALRKKGFEFDNNAKYRGQINDNKLDENISRARRNVFEYALCNPWELFATMTLDPTKYNRTDLNKFNSDLNYFIKNYNKKYNLNIKRLLIPETHKDGESWHMHGLIYGLPISHLRLFTLDEYLPLYIKNKLKKGQKVYEWVPYREKFGFNDFEEVQNVEACGKYITKYITKELGSCVKELNAHLYYCSRGLEKSTIEKKGHPMCEMDCPSFENDFVKVFNYDSNMPIEYLKSLID